MALTTEEKNLFKIFAREEELTNKIFKKYDYSAYHIQKLMDAHMIKRTSPGCYTLADLGRFLEYGRNLELCGLIDEATCVYTKLEHLDKNKTEIDANLSKIYEAFLDDEQLTKETLVKRGLTHQQITAFKKYGILEWKKKGYYVLICFDDLRAYGEQLERAGQHERAQKCFAFADNNGSSQSVDDDMKTIYNLQIDNLALTSNLLEEAGVSGYRLQKLLNLGALTRGQKGVFRVGDYDKFLSYGRELEKNGDTDRAFICYERCMYGLKDSSLRMHIVNHYFLAGQYKRGFKHLATLQNNPVYRNVFYYYLYLLSFIDVLTIYYRKLARTLTPQNFSDLEGLPEGFPALIFEQKFATCLNQLASLEKKTTDATITIDLLNIIKKMRDEFNRSLSEAIEIGDFQAAHELLQKESTDRPLKKNYRIYMTLTSAILSMKNTGTHPNVRKPEGESIMDFIRAHRYGEAYERALNLGNKKGIDPTKNHLAVLLHEASRLMDKIDAQNSTPKISEDTKKTTEFDSKTIVALQRQLEICNLSGAQNILNRLLIENNLTEYAYLIEGLIEICYETDDGDFMRPISTLIKLIKGTFEMEISKYVAEFKNALDAGNFAVARLYMGLIKLISQKGYSDIADKELARILSSLSNQIRCRQISSQSTKSFTNSPNHQNS